MTPHNYLVAKLTLVMDVDNWVSIFLMPLHFTNSVFCQPLYDISLIHLFSKSYNLKNVPWNIKKLVRTNIWIYCTNIWLLLKKPYMFMFSFFTHITCSSSSAWEVENKQCALKWILSSSIAYHFHCNMSIVGMIVTDIFIKISHIFLHFQTVFDSFKSYLSIFTLKYLNKHIKNSGTNYTRNILDN